jgi:hypothetical protein
LTQASGSEHTRPQAPQFRWSLRGSTHDPPQLTWVPVHWATQAPLTQVAFGAQALPHPPQLNSSWRMSTQPPLQAWSPAVQLATQAPA